MKLKTSLLLSAIFPVAFALFVFVLLKLRMGTVTDSHALDAGFAVILAVLGAGAGGVILWYSYDILRKIRILNKWAYAVLKGNLDHNIDVSGDDEVGRLSKTLSKMLKELKQAYTDLEIQSQHEKKRASVQQQGTEVSQEAVRRLTDTLAKLKESQADLVQQERAAAMEQVIRGMAHDFGEVMVPILGTCDHLVEHPEELDTIVSAMRHIKTIQDSAVRAKKLLKNLAGIFPAPQEIANPAEASSAIKQAIKMAQPSWREQASAEGRSIEIKTSLQLVPAAAVEESDLRDAVVNLILNSVEAMPNGGTIDIACRCDEGLAVIIEVSDTGKGMTEEVRKRILEPFYSTKGESGKGVGLSMVDAMVRRYNGVLTINSQKGLGTRVSMSFPLWTRKAPSIPAKRAEEKLRSSLRILVVDDDWMSRKTVARALEVQEYLVETAESGEQGLEKIEAGQFDIAIIDRAMPGMSGDELAEAIKKAREDMPVVMLTGFGDIMVQEGDLPPCVDTILAKPVSMEDLQRGLMDAFTPKPVRTTSVKPEAPSSRPASDDGGDVKWLD